jgi:glycopeptide antibiotics resistance protein
MTTIIGYIWEMIPYLIIALPFILIFRVVYNKIRGVQKINGFHEIGVVAFLLFMTAVLSQTILTFLYTGPVVTRAFSNLNLIPFRVFQDNYYAITELNFWQPFIINFLGNICIFMPIGFMVPLLWNRFNKFWKVALIGLLISLFIETTQLSQARSSDIDDLWLNTVGSMLGYNAYRIVAKHFPSFTCLFKKEK